MRGLLLLCLTSAAFGQAIRDDFAGYAAGSDGTPAWEPQGVFWTMADGAYQGDGSYSLWRAAAFGSDLTFAADLTVLEVLKGDWLTAGLGLWLDDRNYWACNLVVAPDKQNRKHFTELQECLDGTWLAAGQEGTRLPSLPRQGDSFDWRLNHPYRIELTLTPASIVGRILDGPDEVARFGHRLDVPTKAVRAGRPGLRVGGLKVRFDNAEVTVRQTADEPQPAPRAVTPWVSRDGQAMATGTGVFATHQADGRWWLLDPEGKPYFDVGTDHVNFRAHWCEKLGYAPYSRNVAALYGSEEKWAETATGRLKEWGFNTVAAGHSPSVRHRGLAHILFASFGSGFARREWLCEPIHWTGFPDVFSPKWEPFCAFVARRIAAESKDDPWCIGTFLDNELEWYGKQGSLVDEVFRRGSEQPGKQALWAWLMKRYGSLPALNARLKTGYADERAFLTSVKLPPASPELDAVRDGFLAEIAERYFSVPAKALKAAGFQHLVMGCRFAGRAPAPALAAAGKYNDVFTFNTYPRVDFQSAWAPGVGGQVHGVPRQLSDMYAVVGKPMIITEWSFPALDSGLPCRHGAGMRVDTQEQKAACYRIFANALADLPFMVGYHYFMWADEPAEGISSTFPEDSNYGLVDVNDRPYEVLVKAATETNQAAEQRHAGSLASASLTMVAADGGVRVTNPDQVPSRGLLRLAAGGTPRIETIVLAPGQSRVVKAPPGTWTAELRQWDGTPTRLIGGAALPAGAVANASAQSVADLPAVVDQPEPRAALVSLAPGQQTTLPAPEQPWREVETLDLRAETVTWACAGRDGGLFDSIKVGDLALGRLVFAVHQLVGGVHQWVETDRVVSLKTRELPDAVLVEAVVERAGGGTAITAVDAAGVQAAAPTGPARYRAAVRAAVFKRGGLALVRPLWVASQDPRPWTLKDAFWFCRPAIGGDPVDDGSGGPDVPNYYLPAQFWTDAKLGGAFGAAGGEGGWRVQFWKDPGGGFHPDSYFRVDAELANGQRWSADSVPYLWLFAAADPAAGRAVAARRREADGLVVAGP